MSVHLYLSLLPEALVASMLEPEDFGVYYAVGSHKKLHGQAIFIEVDPDFRHEFFQIDDAVARCDVGNSSVATARRSTATPKNVAIMKIHATPTQNPVAL